MAEESDGDASDAADARTEHACAFCGIVSAGARPPLTSTVAVENGRRRRYCERCSREHLRSMEAKLDSEWW